ncbi:cytochrome P450 [Prescottella equi]
MRKLSRTSGLTSVRRRAVMTISMQMDRLRVIAALSSDPLAALESIANGTLTRSFRIGRRTVHFPASAQAVEDVLLKHPGKFSWRDGVRSIMTITGPSAFGVCDGELHRLYRAPVEPAFSRDRHEHWDAAVEKVCNELVDELATQGTVELTTFIQQFVRRAVLRCLFNDDIARHEKVIGDAFEPGFKYMNSVRTLLQVPAPFTKYKRALESRSRADSVIERAVAQRRSTCPYAETSDSADIVDNYLRSAEPGFLSDRVIRQQVSEIVAAGQETTSATFSWIVFELAQNPNARRRVEDEARALHDAPASYRSSKALRYTRAVVSETLRLHPPVPVAPRTAESYMTLDGAPVAPGDLVVLSQHVRHRDPNVWSDGRHFSPERWLDGRAASDRFSYFPFGIGARKCIGQELAKRILIQFTLALYGNFDVAMTSVNDGRMKGIVTIVPANGVSITVAPPSRIGESRV